MEANMKYDLNQYIKANSQELRNALSNEKKAKQEERKAGKQAKEVKREQGFSVASGELLQMFLNLDVDGKAEEYEAEFRKVFTEMGHTAAAVWKSGLLDVMGTHEVLWDVIAQKLGIEYGEVKKKCWHKA